MNERSDKKQICIENLPWQMRDEISFALKKHMSQNSHVEARHLMRFDQALGAIEQKHLWISFTQYESMLLVYRGFFGIKAEKFKEWVEQKITLAIMSKLGD